ncbi:AP-like endonuclease reverse transcriptase [Brachionus plicatilis]|uniref:AP-like endonuclease reverse transcriptase n=1 Tax=Brachionus plicatilis TaxID=10195 RepID=A0A3M7PJ64_BRAPC|nr:AP-like endonuclease reverse transcriptase [Brachionus plicatilis]
MGFQSKQFKTCFTVFTTAGLRKNYNTKCKLDLKINEDNIPQDPNPTFLGIKLGPKLCFKSHLENMEKKLIPKTNLIKRIKNFKWSNSISLNRTLYKSLISSLFDYCFVILNSGTEKIKTALHKIQNKILRTIKYFPIKTSIETIHKVLRLETVHERSNALFIKFKTSKSKLNLIANEIREYQSEAHTPRRFETPFDMF